MESRCPEVLKATASSTSASTEATSSAKSLIVHKCASGLAYQGSGRLSGLRHAASEQQFRPNAPMPEIGERDDGTPADAQQILQHGLGVARRLDGQAEDRVVERLVGIVGEVAVGVALDDRQAARHAGVDPLAR